MSLQAQACMAEFMRDGFRDHKGINSAYTRFMIRSLASQSSIGLSKSVSDLTTRMGKVETAAKNAALQTTMDRIVSKVNEMAKTLEKKQQG